MVKFSCFGGHVKHFLQRKEDSNGTPDIAMDNVHRTTLIRGGSLSDCNNLIENVMDSPQSGFFSLSMSLIMCCTSRCII
jgi:hypothetical protein